MSIDIDCDLDARSTAPAVAPAPRWRKNLPWTVAGVASATAVSLLAVLIARPAPVHAAASAAEPTATATAADPTISSASSDGWNADGATVWRDNSGQVLAVMEAISPYNHEEVWCRLDVNGQTIEVHTADGQPAICVWVRDAA